LRSYRYAGHAAVLLIAMGMSGYGAADLSHSVARAGAVNAMAANENAQYGDVVMGRDSTIIKPVSIPIAPLPNRKPLRYTVQAGDTLDGIARDLGITVRQITWSNPGLKQPLKAGLALRLSPVPGVVVVARKGDTAASLATLYGADETAILGFNGIRAADLAPGMVLVIPVDPVTGPNLSTGVPADPIDPGQLMCPIQGAKIIQKFGPTSFAIEPAYGGYLHFHSGVDLLAEYGTPIVAAAGGRVTAVRRCQCGERIVRLDRDHEAGHGRDTQDLSCLERELQAWVRPRDLSERNAEVGRDSVQGVARLHRVQDRRAAGKDRDRNRHRPDDGGVPAHGHVTDIGGLSIDRALRRSERARQVVAGQQRSYKQYQGMGHVAIDAQRLPPDVPFSRLGRESKETVTDRLPEGQTGWSRKPCARR